MGALLSPIAYGFLWKPLAIGNQHPVSCPYAGYCVLSHRNVMGPGRLSASSGSVSQSVAGGGISHHFIISGSLAIATENTESRCLVQTTLGWNIVSAVVSSLELVILIVDVVMNSGSSCDASCVIVWVVRETVFISLIIASALELCVSISISSFGCSSLIQNSVSQQQGFVMQTDGLVHNVHPTISHLGVSASSAVALIPQYPAFPTNYQKNIPNNPNNSSPPQ
ncbi:membrane-spanning 4-domains subfamily A member 18-like [Engystomops pustulosus]|uniref:membrane-spanning 4-domains subfamily A member 18-like n=1 Tax=Engystomops pustulosus TaxID=76066 RepID=UPI003AFABD2E